MNIIDKLEKLESDNKIPFGFVSKFENIKKGELITVVSMAMDTIPSFIFGNEYRYRKIIEEYRIKIAAIMCIDPTIGDNFQDYMRAISVYDGLVSLTSFMK